MKKYLISYSIVLSLGLLFTANAFAENTPKSTWLTKTYCFFYLSRCVADVSSVVATTTASITTSIKPLDIKKEDKGIITNTFSWIRSLKANKIEAKTICVEDVCVNKGQFLKMVDLINNQSPIFTVSFTTNDGNGTTTRIITR